MERPCVSVVVSVLNSAGTLQRCIDSVAGQTWPLKELIVIDGGSKDGAVEILRANEKNLAYWESKPDRGIYDAWNKALDHATGEWICFIGADDYLWEPNVLEAMIPHLTRATGQGIRIVYGRIAFMSREGEKILYMDGRPWKEARRRIREYMTYAHCGSFNHRDLFRDRGKFDETFLIGGDYEMALRELQSREALFVPEVVVAGMRFGGVSASLDGRLRVIRETSLARRRNGIRKFSWRLLFWRIRILLMVGLRRSLGDRAVQRVADWYRLAMGRERVWKQ